MARFCVPHYYGESQVGRLAGTDIGKGEFFPTGALGNLSETTIELYLWSLNPADVKRILPNPPDRRSVQGWIEFLQGRQTELPDRSDAAGTPGRLHDRPSACARRQRIRPEPRRFRVACQPHARRGEFIRLRRRSPQSGPVFRSRTASCGSCSGRRRARRKDRAGQRNADAHQYKHARRRAG